MRGGLLAIALFACSHPRPTGPVWPKTHVHDSDGGESLAPRAAARAIAAVVDDDRPTDRAAGEKPAVPAAAGTATPGASTDKPALTPSVTVTEEPLTAEEMVIEIDD
jgi:hypothetical protein